jgi:hypothetical protein
MDPVVLSALEVGFAEWPQSMGGAVPEQEIAETEAILGVAFPEQYRDFVARYGGAVVGAESIVGLRVPEFLVDLHPTVVEATRFWHSELPETAGWLVFETDGGGNPIGFRLPDERVWTWDHDFGGLIEVASDFEGFVRAALKIE